MKRKPAKRKPVAKPLPMRGEWLFDNDFDGWSSKQ
jgi:hypothetical protein